MATGLPICTVNDFKNGMFSLPSNNKMEANLQSYITYYEKYILYKLLSSSLADLFIADLENGEPKSDRFKKIMELGIKFILKCHIYYFYSINDMTGYLSQAGVVYDKVDSATTINPSISIRAAEERFNRCVNNCDKIQNYILNNLNIYPEFIISSTDDPSIIRAEKIKMKFRF